MTQANGTTTTTGAQGDPNAQSTGQEGQEAETHETFDAFLATQPDTVKALYQAHTQGLQNALKSERTQRSTLEKQLREAAKKQPADSAEQANLTKMADDLAEANRRADFFQEAAKPEVGLTDPHLAWLAINANAEDYVNKRGDVNFVLLKERHPGLFKQVVAAARGNAGNGVGTGAGAGKTNMNTMIRKAAGRE